MKSVRWPTNASRSSDVDITPSEQLLSHIHQYLSQEKVAAALADRMQPLYLPMADWLLQKRANDQTLIIGISGAQGSGKSTLAGLLSVIFEQGYGLNVAKLSLDDLYLGRQARAALANEIHPLLQTRGVPGTHDIDLGLELIEKLRDRQSRDVAIPRFDKSTDERLPPDKGDRITTPVDIILLEGWCVGASAQAIEQLQAPMNDLEASEDPHAVWRCYVNQQLSGPYQLLFQQIDVCVMLKTPSMQQVREWRGLQEMQLAAASGRAGMDPQQLERFIMHYERLTRHQLIELPERADAVLQLGENHQISKITLKVP